MLNQIAIRVFEDVCGKTWSSCMEEATGVAAKTWKKGGPRSPAVVERARIDMRANVLQAFQTRGGYSYDEAVVFCRKIDWKDAELWLGLVRWGLPPDDHRRCPSTETIARQLDELGNRLDDLRKAENLIEYREALLDSGFLEQGEEWFRLFNDTDTARLIATPVRSWDDLNPLIAAVLPVALFRFLASWDIECHANYMTDQMTGRGLAPRPLFKYVLPRLRPGSVTNSEGRYPTRGLFSLPLRRLLELAYCLATYHRTKYWPSKREVSRTRVAAAGGVVLQGPEQTEQPLAKIHKGTRGLKSQEFADVWLSMCGSNSEGVSPLAPWPIYFAAQIWTTLFVQKSTDKKSSGASTVFVLDEDAYQYWWDRCLGEFRARGTKFGSIPWPDYSLKA